VPSEAACKTPLQLAANKYHHSQPLLAVYLFPSYNTPPCEAPTPFTIRPYRHFPAQCAVTYHAGLFQGQGTIWNLSCTGWRLSGDLPMRPGETLSLTVTLPNEQHIEVPEAVVRWSRGQEFAVENLAIKLHTRTRLQHYVKRLAQESVESIP
jgi:hypothetical protein